MPSTNAIKIYEENSYYHVYNRGVDKRLIFLDKSDYIAFLGLLKRYLYPFLEIKDPYTGEVRMVNNKDSLDKEVYLLCFCLMPNHFHFLLKQITKNGMQKFMKNLTTSYVLYFNEKYERKGRLFQGVYKATNIFNEEYFLHLSRYIHLNPLPLLNRVKKLEDYDWSSFLDYIGKRNIKWLHKDEIFSYFNDKYPLKQNKTYQEFIELNVTEDYDFSPAMKMD
ncbi:transposase [Patescibacteria group bacterium]|nr:transposase [Patescibacteria group bacterium]